MDSTKSLELKILDCKDLTAFNFFQKLLVYVLVSLVSDDPEKKIEKNQQQRTPTDSEGDGYPEWKHEMQFDLSEISFVDCDHFFIRFELCHEGLYFGDKIIGEVRVPLKDMIHESSGILRFVNYQVQSPDGRPNGILNFSYKVNVKVKEDMRIDSPTTGITGYSVVVHHHHEYHPPPGDQNPVPEFQSSSPRIQYPSLDFEQPSHYPPSQPMPPQYSYQESHYAPNPYGYYPPSQHMPPPLQHSPPAPAYGACYNPSYPPSFGPWPPGPVYDHSTGSNWSPTGGPSHGFGHVEGGRNDYRDHWNGS
ncbi:Calcium-dependent lipid-binding (CaLB domain) family protein [Euphorbia peplus]|nr:Calcium-dependent lipid-binding (CaLB domain) family protein [Euphorbia peplus]